MPSLGRKIARGKHLPVIVLLLVVDVNHGSQVSRDVCRIGCDFQGAGSARGQWLELLKEFGPIHDDAVLVNEDGVGSERLLPNLPVAGCDGIQESLVLGTQQLRCLVCGIG